MEIIVFANQKGGVGKTSLALNVAGCLAARKRRTLVVDLDPQGNLSNSFALPKEADTALGIFKDDHVSSSKVGEFLSIVPAHKDLSGVLTQGFADAAALFRLRNFLDLTRDFDFVILDTPPTLSGLTLSAFIAASHLVAVVSTNYYTLQGTQDLLGTFLMVQKHFGSELRFLGAAVAIHDRRTALANEVLERVKEGFGGEVFKTVIPRVIKVEEAQVVKKPVVVAFPESDIAKAYERMTEEILRKIESVQDETR